MGTNDQVLFECANLGKSCANLGGIRRKFWMLRCKPPAYGGSKRKEIRNPQFKRIESICEKVSGLRDRNTVESGDRTSRERNLVEQGEVKEYTRNGEAITFRKF